MFNEDNQEDVTLENDIEEVEEIEEEEEESTPSREAELEAENKKLKAILERNKNKTDKPTKSNDFGYDVKAYLKASGIKASEFDFVKTELKKSGMKDVDALLENEYFNAALEKHRAVAKTADAIPKGNRSGGVATDSVDYWLSKPFEEVPVSMRREVVNAKVAKEKNQGKFYNS